MFHAQRGGNLRPLGRRGCQSSDGNVLPEIHHLGAVLWRHHFGRLLDEWIGDGVLTAADAERLALDVGAGNAARSAPDLLRDLDDQR